MALKVDPDVVALLDGDMARTLGVVPIRREGDRLLFATTAPDDHRAAQQLTALAGIEAQPLPASRADIAAAQETAYGPARVRYELLPPSIARILDPDATAAAEVADAAESAQPATNGRAPTSASRQRLGDVLRERDELDPDTLDKALDKQRRYGDRLGEVLMHTGAASETAVVSALARQFDAPHVDLNEFDPLPDVVALLPERLMRHHRVMPLEIANHRLRLATVGPLSEETLSAVREHTQLPIEPVMVEPSALYAALQRTFRDHHARTASRHLLERSPKESAHYVLSFGQRVAGFVLLSVLVIGLIVMTTPTLIVANVIGLIFYATVCGYRLLTMYRSLTNDLELRITDEEVAAIDERTLPIFTLLIPLYREAVVVPQLMESIARLDYPPTRLDVKLLLEEDDEETIAALDALDLPPHFVKVIVPDGEPKTKPKACNHGLSNARGKYVVIYDAEDAPEPDQLKKVVLGFERSDPDVACIQCKLNYYNRNQNLLTRWFTSEYSMWFDLLLPGLAAKANPIPLGGTSNHFLVEKLVEVGAWDPFNVTEDADLGVRLYRVGVRTAIINSTTYEEANSQVGNWIRQRSRWVKGYIQTWLVHMRNPFALWRSMGARAFISFQFTVAGTFFTFLLNPIYWLLTTLWLLTEAGFIRELFPGLIYYAAAFGLIVGNFTFAYIGAAAAAHRGYHELIRSAMIAPIYWMLMSIGAWRGLWQLITKPSYWEKTVHGLHLANDEPGASGPPGPPRPVSEGS
jgi:cellulose synthase/poly-beta-1,6-N-acetylglucosamine synthase-like glycosyltransferase